MAERLGYWLHDGDDAPVGFGISQRRAVSPESISGPPPLSKKSATSHTLPSTRSTVSSSSGSRQSSGSDASSRKSSTSTAPSTAPSEHGPAPWHIHVTNTTVAVAPIAARYYLPCDFAFVGCTVTFRPEEYGAWVTHSLSHFERAGPPPKVICTFCDDDEATFETNGDRALNWRTRMFHVAEHFENGKTYDDLRPDFFVVEHMRKNGLLSEEDFKLAMEFTERPKGV